MRRWYGMLALSGLLAMMMALGWQSARSQSSLYETRIVVLKAQVNLAAVWGNRTAVKRTLMQTAEQSQLKLIPQLDAWQKQGTVRRYQRFWIINAIAVEATNDVFNSLAQHPLVAAIRPNFPITLPRPTPGRIAQLQAYTWGLQKIRIPETWRDFGVQGEGIVVGVIDTGIDATHPDLQGKLRPRNGWFDAVNGRPTPYDDHGHGTHVSGTIAGGSASGTYIGVAPKATLIEAKGFDSAGSGTFAWITACMQWVMDPDNDPNTDDGADVVNNSWATAVSTSPDLIPEWRDIINAWIAARMFPSFGIGNTGPNPRTTGSPGDYPMAFGVGATDINDNIADFSSRGPVFWTGIGDITKPDVSAPGVDVFSSVPGGRYESWQGTSMAAPHVSGVVALMMSLARERNVDERLDVDFFKQALEQTAVDLGAPGKDNDYGSGRIDAYEAMRKVPPPPVVRFPDFSQSTMSVSVPEAALGDLLSYSVRVVNSGDGTADRVVVTVSDVPLFIPPSGVFSDIQVLDGGTFNLPLRQITWSLTNLAPGQSATLRFNAIVDPQASPDQTVILSASIAARGAPTFITNFVSTRIVSPVDPLEVNDFPAQAKGVEEGETQRLYLGANDEDWVKITLQAEKVYWLEVRAWQAGSPLNARLRVYQDAGQTLIADSRDYIGPDPVALLLTSGGGEFYLRVTPDENVPAINLRGSYRLVIRDVTPTGGFSPFAENQLELKVGEVAIVMGALQNTSGTQRQLLTFNIPFGLRLIAPSQAKRYAPTPRPSSPDVEPSGAPTLSDWLLFIADSNEAALSEVSPLPTSPLNIGRIWVQGSHDVLFFRVEFVGRRLKSLSEMALVIGLDTNGDDTPDFTLRFNPTEQGIYRDAQKSADFAFLNLTERSADIGVRWEDIGDPTQMRLVAQLTDNTVGSVDRAPDNGLALLHTAGEDGFGASPAAGSLAGGSGVTVWFIADARNLRTGDYFATLTLSDTTLIPPPSQNFQLTVQPGQPAQIAFRLSATQVPSTTEQVTATVTVTDAAGNGVGNQTVRLTLSPTELGSFAETGTITTDSKGQAQATIFLTGKAGTLTVQAEVVGTTLVATQFLTVTPGAIADVQLEVTPTPVTVDGTIAITIRIVDEKGNLVPNTHGTLIIIPVEGIPRPEDFTAYDGTKTFTKGVGDKAGTMVVSVQVGQTLKTVEVSVLPGSASRLTLLEPIEIPTTKLVGDKLHLKVKVTDDKGNPIPSKEVLLTVQQGLSISSDRKTTDSKGEAVFSLQFKTPSIYKFWLTVDSIRQPSDVRTTFKVQAFPALDAPAEKVRGFGIPFLPPEEVGGQQPPTLSGALGIDDPQALQGRIFRYNPARARFELVDLNEPFSTFGTGFFVKPRQPVSFRPTRGRLPETDMVELSLQPGWNLISFPIPIDFGWSLRSVQVQFGVLTRPIPLSQATSVVLPFLWRWDSEKGFRLVYDATLAKGDFESRIHPWDAYFVYTFQPCTLFVPVPFGVRQQTSLALSSAPAWNLFSITVQQGERTTTLLFGIGKEGQSLEVPMPPSPLPTRQVAIISDNGTPLGMAVRPMERRIVWAFSVPADQEGEVTVSGSNLANIPRNWALSLFDPTTGERRSLRTGSYRMRLSEGEERKLLIIAEPQTGVPLQVRNIKVTSTRGRSLALEFTLTANAQTEIVVQSLTGRTVRILETNISRTTGVHRVVWNGTDNSGLTMPAGAYLVRIIARDFAGQIAQGAALVRIR